MKRARGVAMALVLASTVSFTAHAEPSPEDRAAAQALFDEARDLVKKGHAADACPKLEDSQRLDPGIGTQLYLADCYEKMGRVASAWIAFLEAAEAAQKAGDAKRAALANENAKRLEPGVPRVRIVVPAGVEGIVVSRDGKDLATSALSTALPTDPGRRVFEARAPKHERVRVEVDVKAGAPIEVTIPPLPPQEEKGPPVASTAPPPSASAPPPAPSPVTTTSRGLGTVPIAGIVVAGVGVAAAVTGAFVGAAAKSKNDDAKASGCRPDGTYCTPDAMAQHDDAKKQASLATVLLIGGGALVAGGASMFLFGGPSSDREASLWIAPATSPRSAGVSLGGAF